MDEVENVDLISCLNVLDRCADPHQILSDIHRALSPNGRAVIALVLPYSHYVETSKFQADFVIVNPAAKLTTFFSFFFFVCRHIAFANQTIIAGLAKWQFIAIRSRGKFIFRTIGIDEIQN